MSEKSTATVPAPYIAPKVELPTGAESLLLCRWARGIPLENLCNRLTGVTRQYRDVDVRNPSQTLAGRSRFDFVNQRARKKTNLTNQGVVPEELYHKLSKAIPSVLEARSLTPTGIDIHSDEGTESDDPATYVSLQFGNAKGQELSDERLAVWEMIATLGNISLSGEGFDWLQRVPEVRLARIPDTPPVPHLIRKVKRTVESAFPITVVFEPVYGYPETMEPELAAV